MAHLRLKLRTLSYFSARFIFLSFFFISVLPDDAYGEEETAYMLRLMNALTPTPPTWSNNTNICSWKGVDCVNGFVNVIDLTSMSLTGILPSGLNDTFLYLTKLYLYDNALSGPLPSLANLDQLQHVDLNTNNFTYIPEGCFQGLIALQSLHFQNNFKLKPWKFPIDLTQSPVLTYLDLSATNLIGSVPDAFDSFRHLQGLYLSNNNLSGVLPKSFAGSKIEYLSLNDQVSYGKLSGTIEVLSSMTDLVTVELQGNRFEGPIPDLSNCSNMRYLQLRDNQLTGIIPPSLMNLSYLWYVSLDRNFLQGPLPVFGYRVNASLGDKSSNSFCLEHAGPCDQSVTILLDIAAAFQYPIVLARSWKGNNPCKGWSFIKCDGSKITKVNLTKLNLTGTISPAFRKLTNLRNLYLGGNNLRGSMPESLATLPQLEAVDVSNNHLSGKIPKFSHKVKFTATGNDFLQHSQARATTWIAGASAIGAGVIVIVVVVIYNHKRCLSLAQNMMFKQSRTCIDQSVEDFIKSYGFLGPKRYSYLEVKKMTNSFRDKLGQGGYGIVFKATLTDGRQVAVKVLSESEGDGEKFINEVASISRTSHVNIVSLLGFCYEINKRALIYEFMPNGSLDKFIYEKRSSDTICNLDWDTLYKITIGIARELEYLHQGCGTRIVHLDIKPQNILLDEDYCPKIADFGLAKICRKKESIVSVVGPRGTIGYIAPGVFSRTYGGVSYKSDVYSYGMLILDIVGGRKNYYIGGSHTSEMYFPDWIYKDLEQGNIPTRCLVSTNEESDMVMKIILVSLWCTQQNPSDTPSMSKVIEMLEGPLQSVPHPPKPVICSPNRPPLQFSNISSSSTLDTNSIAT